MKFLLFRGFKRFEILIPASWTTAQINEWVSQQKFWKDLMGDIESFGSDLYLNSEGTFEVSDDNGQVEVTLIRSVNKPTEIWEF